ncbi:hypothetical protein Pyrde_0230 [Pyrodictium delaneyi]|uniref:Uncharacterized protein n=2 Tax=Pyrodictium delaneyi TaxID=1273541 RepID=A0A0P0N169_9CREN|nr:hypothetical protein Pyrde_0230 [Pyrodictium delaneyi]OWJ54353.1 hypothetical protein Pdsh_07705 [Pyrodictium delaneyi]
MMTRARGLLILALLLVATSTIAARAAEVAVVDSEPQPPQLFNATSVYNDSSEFDGYADMALVVVNKTSTGVDLILELSQPLPDPATETDPITRRIDVPVILGPKPPIDADAQSYGVTIYCTIESSPSGTTNTSSLPDTATCLLDTSRGKIVIGINMSSPVIPTGNFYITIAPWVNITVIDAVDNATNLAIDPLNSTTVTITVDGDPSDWNAVAGSPNLISVADADSVNEYDFADVVNTSYIAILPGSGYYTLYALVELNGTLGAPYAVPPYIMLYINASYSYNNGTITGVEPLILRLDKDNLWIYNASMSLVLGPIANGTSYYNISMSGKYIETGVYEQAIDDALRAILNLTSTDTLDSLNLTITGTEIVTLINDNPLGAELRPDLQPVYIAIARSPESGESYFVKPVTEYYNVCIAAGDSYQVSGAVTNISLVNTDTTNACISILLYNTSPLGLEELGIPGITFNEFYYISNTGGSNLSVILDIANTTAALEELAWLGLGLDAIKAVLLPLNETYAGYINMDTASTVNMSTWVFAHTPVAVVRPSFTTSTVVKGNIARHVYTVENLDYLYPVSISIAAPADYTLNASLLNLDSMGQPGSLASIEASIDTSILSPGYYEALINFTDTGSGATGSARMITIVAPETATVVSSLISGTGTILVPDIDASLDVNSTDTVNVTVITLNTTAEALPGKPRAKLIAEKSFDVIVDNTTAINTILVKVRYTDSDVQRWGVYEVTLRLYRWDPVAKKWIRLKTTGVDVVNNVIWAEVQPDELVGAPIAPAGSPAQLVGGELELPAMPTGSNGGIKPAVLLAAGFAVVAAIVMMRRHMRLGLS